MWRIAWWHPELGWLAHLGLGIVAMIGVAVAALLVLVMMICQSLRDWLPDDEPEDPQ